MSHHTPEPPRCTNSSIRRFSIEVAAREEDRLYPDIEA